MKKFLFICLGVFLLSALPALAHQPRLVFEQEISEKNPVVVENPEVSKAYYGELKGQSDYYKISVTEAFNLYVNILVPDVAGVQKNISFEISHNGEAFFWTAGEQTDWEAYYEEFAGDDYFKGAEFDMPAGKGEYAIRVFSPANQGKYVLVVGQKEEFPLPEIIKTGLALPALKTDFFGKSLSAVFSGKVKWFLLGAALIKVLILGLIVWLVVKIFRKRK